MARVSAPLIYLRSPWMLRHVALYSRHIRAMTWACRITCGFYLFGMIMIGLIPWLRIEPRADPVRPIDRARQRQ